MHLTQNVKIPGFFLWRLKELLVLSQALQHTHAQNDIRHGQELQASSHDYQIIRPKGKLNLQSYLSRMYENGILFSFASEFLILDAVCVCACVQVCACVKLLSPTNGPMIKVRVGNRKK